MQDDDLEQLNSNGLHSASRSSGIYTLHCFVGGIDCCAIVQL
jgi:hypothetical protein